MGAFGEKLRKQRERQGITLDDISSTTKISTRMLRALEDEHFDQLPGGVFNKGFVRAYARQIGLDEQEAVADYLAATQIPQPSTPLDFRAPAGKPAAITAPDPRSDDLPREDRRKGGRRHEDLRNNHRSNNNRSNNNEDGGPVDLTSSPDSTTLTPLASRVRQKYSAGSPAQPADDPAAQIPWGKLAVTLLLVTLALALWNSRRHVQPATAAQPAASSVQSSTSAPVPFSAPAPTATKPSSSAISPSAAKASPSAIQPAAKPFAGAVPAATTPPTATRASTTPPEAAAPASSVPAPPTSTASAAANSPATVTLLIRAEKTAWVSIMADGKPVTAETLIAPAHSSVRASREIVVKTGNAAGVSFLLNGKEIPAEGNDGEVKTYVFDATGVRILPQTQPAATNH